MIFECNDIYIVRDEKEILSAHKDIKVADKIMKNMNKEAGKHKYFVDIIELED